MIPLLALIPCPLAIALLALAVRHSRVLTRMAASLMIAQVVIAAWFWGPLCDHIYAFRHPADLPAFRVHGHRILIGFSTDPLTGLFVLLSTLVVASALVHSVGFFDREIEHAPTDALTGGDVAVLKHDHAPTRRHIAQFYFFVPLFLLAMYSVVAADNLGYLWIGMEATTLLSAPLVYFHRSRTALEATWKYVIICSVGIAFAFFGTAMLYAASQQTPGLYDGSLSLTALEAHARALPPGLVRVGYVFVLLGYGTKAGLFPLHSWLPDAHSEAPAPASAILSGSLLNCALVALWRISHLVTVAGQGLLVRETLLPMAAATAVAAALLLIKQRDIKRLLAYSSMENVGLIAGAIGLGSPSGFALQAVNHSLIKVALFLVAGNLLQEYDTKKIRELRGLLAAQPAQAILLLLLIAAVAGSPPFGSFLAEWQILTVAADGRHVGVVVALSIALALSLIALMTQTATILFGQPKSAANQLSSEPTGAHPLPLVSRKGRGSGYRIHVRSMKVAEGLGHLPQHEEKTVEAGWSKLWVPGLLLAASLYLGTEMTPHLLAWTEAIGR